MDNSEAKSYPPSEPESVGDKESGDGTSIGGGDPIEDEFEEVEEDAGKSGDVPADREGPATRSGEVPADEPGVGG